MIDREIGTERKNGGGAVDRFDPPPMAGMDDALRETFLGGRIGEIIWVEGGERPDPSPRRDMADALRNDGSYLVAGGFGGLGLAVAAHLAKGRPGAIILLGDQPPSDAALTRIDAIRRGGTHVEVMQGDIADATDMRHLLNWIDHNLPRLAGVFLGSTPCDAQGQAVGADAWSLHQATLRFPLEHFVVFSTQPGEPHDADDGGRRTLPMLIQQRAAMALPAAIVPVDRSAVNPAASSAGEWLEALDTILSPASAERTVSRMD